MKFKKRIYGSQRLRDSVESFAWEMERKLAMNDHREGWDDEEFSFFLRRIRQEVTELKKAFNQLLDYRDGAPSVIARHAFTEECADIANFAMMIADVYGITSAEADAASEGLPLGAAP